ncbi:MAG: SDR family NAD(P)-dependent oxidoreductase, partial [Alphaproteobacteria bacterium]
VAANYVGPAQVLGALAEQFVARGSGTLVAISSVAGERGRAANYSYGSAKAGLTAWLSGLRNRLALAGSPVRVVTVILGYAQTPMTEGMDLPGWLVSSPEAVAGRVVRAVERGQDVIYVSRKWRLIMAIIRLIPERVFKRLRL